MIYSSGYSLLKPYSKEDRNRDRINNEKWYKIMNKILTRKHTFPKGLQELKLQWSLWHSEKSRAKGLLNASQHHQQVRVSALNSVFPVDSAFTAPSLHWAAWPPCGPQWRLDKRLTSIIKCGTGTILNLTLHSQLSYHVSLSNLAGTFLSPHVLPITLQYVLIPPKQP